MPEREVRRESPLWLLRRYEMLQEARWAHTVARISAVEAGTMRALAAILGKKGRKLPKLPTYDEIRERNLAETEVPSWWDDYARANPQVEL